MEVRFLNAVCILIEICEKKLDSMCFFLCKAPISYYLVIEIPVKAALVDWEKNRKSLVNDVGNDDGGLQGLSQAKGGTARPR